MIQDSFNSPLTSRPTDIPNLTVPCAVTPFYLTEAPVRGRLIRLGPLADALLSRHPNLPDTVLTLGGQALALVAAMATTLKFTGSFSLQIKGNGPVSLFLADCTDSGALRFTARMAQEPHTNLPQNASDIFGTGYLAFTVDQGPDMERHQGIVGIEGTSLAEMTAHYFRTSEQHDCTLHLFAQKDEGHWQAGALVLERLANEGGHADHDDHTENHDDLWETACVFATTLKPVELFNPTLTNQALINRLFGMLGTKIAKARPLSFGCRCNREHLDAVLEQFSPEDLDHMTENGAIAMDCNFCNVQFRFPRDETGNHTP